MPVRYGNGTNSPRKKSTDAIADTVDVGSTNSTGRLLIYEGTQPDTPQDAATGSTLLATINFASPAFTSADSNAAVALSGGAISGTASASGTAQWFRVIDRDNVALIDGSVGESGEDMNFDETAFVSGGTVTISSLTIATPMSDE
jgi:hypothetical protein